MFLYSGNWYIPVNCRIEITIRIRCLRAIFKRPTREQARKLCDMVKAGIKKHWEVDILDNQGNFKLFRIILLPNKFLESIMTCEDSMGMGSFEDSMGSYTCALVPFGL